MIKIRQFSTADETFEAELHQTLSRGTEFDPEVDRVVRKIISQVRREGDAAIVELTRKFDHLQIDHAEDLEISSAELEAASKRLSCSVLDAIRTAHRRIAEFHEHQKEESWIYSEEDGSRYGQQINPIKRVGIYVPGGMAAYPSSVLMTAVPATVAGVDQIIMTVPAPKGKIKDAVLAAVHVAGVDRVFKVGGAQAVAALAFGTRTIPKVDKIVGPGNAWVSAAKRQVFGHVGIDLIAGPSEVVVVCDQTSNADWAAMDLFAQAEHDYDAQSILVSTCLNKLEEVKLAIENMLPNMARKEIIAHALTHQGALIYVPNRQDLVALIDRLAPEHLELMVESPMQLAKQIRNAGAIFVGSHSAEVLGDYCAGPNHVLPTSGSARFASPLGVYDFIKRTSIVACSVEGSKKLATTASVLAREEGLTAHSQSAEFRAK